MLGPGAYSVTNNNSMKFFSLKKHAKVHQPKLCRKENKMA